MASAYSSDEKMDTEPASRSKSEKTILLNFDLDSFRLIPRTAFLFEINPVESYSDKYDAEFLLIDPDFTAVQSPDRYSGPITTSGMMPAKLMNKHTARLATVSISGIIEEHRKSSKIIRDMVSASNRRLRELQSKRFAQRAAQLEQGIVVKESNDFELSKAFYREFESVGTVFDHRSILTRSLLNQSREKDIVYQAGRIRQHAASQGIPRLPSFWLEKTINLSVLDISSEESEWLKDPTIAWSPRQNAVGLSMRASEDARQSYNQMALPLLPKHQGVPPITPSFKLPTYQEYLNINPAYGYRSLPNRGIDVMNSLHPMAHARP